MPSFTLLPRSVMISLGAIFLAALSSSAGASQRMTTTTWRLSLQVNIGYITDDSTTLGTDANATDSYDGAFDIYNPPPLPDQQFDDFFGGSQVPKPIPGTLLADIRGPLVPGIPKSWSDYTIYTTYGNDNDPALVTVTWPGVSDIPSEISLTLLDPNDVDGDGVKEYDMRKIDSFEFPARAAGMATRYVLGVRARLAGQSPAIVKGDLDGNGKVDVKDATLALRAAVGLISLDDRQKQAADMNADGVVNVKDVTLVLRAAVGLS